MQPGEVVAERFEVESRASSGGMGAVFRARDRHTGAVVALKVLHGAWDENVDRFAREARLLAELRHPAIVRYVAHGSTHAGESYLAMEWLEGEELSKRLIRVGLTLRETVHLAKRMSSALAIAHARGVVHRDIKPSNIFLRDGEVDKATLLDFGVARLIDLATSVTRTGMLLGTPGYMAPEQARGTRDVDARADVFALGCVIYKCLTGEPAFAGDGGIIAALAKVLFDDVPRVRDARPSVPAALDDLVWRMLMKEPRGRPADGAAVLAELEALGEDGSDTEGTRPPPSMHNSVLTLGEIRLVSVVLAAVDVSWADEPTIWSGPRTKTAPAVDETWGEGVRQRLREAVEPFGAQFEALANGAVVATLNGRGPATDQAAQAARCALAMRAVAPEVPLALATARGELGSGRTVGEVIERAASMLQNQEITRDGQGPRTSRAGEAASSPIRVDSVTAALLDVRFEVGGDGASFELRRERGGVDTSRTLLGKPTPCVGRERELSSLRALFDESSTEPVARAVLVTSAAGIGKSRLRYEFLRMLQHSGARAQIWIGRGDPMSAGSPFGMLGQAIRAAIGLREGEPLAAQRERLLARVSSHVKPAEARRVAEFLGELLQLRFPDDESVQLRAAREDAILMGDQMRRAWEDFVDAECAVQPVLLVLEDLHWGDLPTVKFVEAALRNLSARPLMVLALARNDVHELFPRLWAERGVQEMRLSELTRKAGEKLARQVLGDGYPPEALAQLVERSAGNAFYLEEILRSVAEGRGDALPESVLAMVQARLEALPSEARRVLRAASIFGEVFWHGGVKALVDGAQPSIGTSVPPPAPGVDDGTSYSAPRRAASLNVEWLTELAESELISRRMSTKFPGQEEFVFRHALVRDAAYAMLTDHDRVLGHKLGGAWLEQLGEVNAAILAEHFERGGEHARAMQSYAQATGQAMEGNDFAAALRMAERAIANGADGELLGALRGLEAEAHNWRGEFADARETGMSAMSLVPQGCAAWYAAAGEVALASARIGDYALLTELVSALKELGAQERIGAPHIVASARAAQHLLGAGEYARVDSVLAQIEALVPRAAPDDPAAAAWIALARSMRADPAASIELAESAILHFERAGDLRSACMVRGNLGDANMQIGRYAEAEQAVRGALTIAERLGLHNVASLARVNLGFALARQGHIKDALEVERVAADEMRAQGDVQREGGARVYLAMIHMMAGDLQAASREVSVALEIVKGTPPIRAYALAVLAHIRRAQLRHREALEAAREAVHVLDELGFITEGESVARLIFALALHDTGEKAEARVAIAHARARLLERARDIQSEPRRESFLTNVHENALTMALAREWLRESGAPSASD